MLPSGLVTGGMFSFAPRAVLPQTPDYPVASEDIVRSLKDARKQDKTASEVPQWLEAQPARDGNLIPPPKCQVFHGVAGLKRGDDW